MDKKKLPLLIGVGGILLIVIVVIFKSLISVQPGEEGFIYRPYGGGVDTNQVFKEGTQLIAPWNEMITYSLLQQSKTYTSTVMDKNGTNITVEVAVNYAVQKGSSAKLHLEVGVNYITIIDDKSQGAIKEVIGNYNYEEVYSTKRGFLEKEMSTILKAEFSKNFLDLKYVKIKDVDLPENIAQEIVNKETQKQRNLTAAEKQKEQEYLAIAQNIKNAQEKARENANKNKKLSVFI